jgi:DNA ligase (NAD+)
VNDHKKISKTHDYRTYSLIILFKKEDLIDWEEMHSKVLGECRIITYSAKLKYDGALVLLMKTENWNEQDSWRWFQGDDVTNNIKKTIDSIQLERRFSAEFDVRGEIILPFAGFEKNESRVNRDW